MTNELNKSLAVLKATVNSMQEYHELMTYDVFGEPQIYLSDLKPVVEAAGLVEDLVEALNKVSSTLPSNPKLPIIFEIRDIIDGALTRANQILGEGK